MKTLRFHFSTVMIATTLALALAVGAPAQNPKDANSLQVYYDGTLLNVQLVEFSPFGQRAHREHHSEANFLFWSDADLLETGPFISVISATPTDDSQIWEAVQVVFMEGHTPRQLTSASEIEAAVDAGEIALIYTGKLYRPVPGSTLNWASQR